MPLTVQKCARFYDQLTLDEQEGYEALREALSDPAYKGRRNQSTETFQQVLDLLKAYVGDSRTRALVCGIVWLDHGFGINTHQLSIVSNRSKSSINGSMQALGYGTVPSGADVSPVFEKFFPGLRGQYSQLRQWTIRRRMDEIPPVLSPGEEGTLGEANSALMNDVCVAAYLNDECTLPQMVRSLIQNRRKNADPAPISSILAMTAPGSPWMRTTDLSDDRIDLMENMWP
jgi:hypothetical protein